MAQTKYIELGDGVIVEIGSPGEKREEMHSGVVERIDTTMEVVGKTFRKILRPLGEAFADLNDSFNVPVQLESAELEIGLSFSAEGSIFIAKSTAEGTLTAKIIFKPVNQASTSPSKQG